MKTKKKRANKKKCCNKKNPAQLLDRHKKAGQQAEQETRRAHEVKKITTEGHPKQMPARKSPHPEIMDISMESPTARMSSSEKTSVGHHYQDVSSWDNHNECNG